MLPNKFCNHFLSNGMMVTARRPSQQHWCQLCHHKRTLACVHLHLCCRFCTCTLFLQVRLRITEHLIKHLVEHHDQESMAKSKQYHAPGQDVLPPSHFMPLLAIRSSAWHTNQTFENNLQWSRFRYRQCVFGDYFCNWGVLMTWCSLPFIMSTMDAGAAASEGRRRIRAGSVSITNPRVGGFHHCIINFGSNLGCNGVSSITRRHSWGTRFVIIKFRWYLMQRVLWQLNKEARQAVCPDWCYMHTASCETTCQDGTMWQTQWSIISPTLACSVGKMQNMCKKIMSYPIVWWQRGSLHPLWPSPVHAWMPRLLLSFPKIGSVVCVFWDSSLWHKTCCYGSLCILARSSERLRVAQKRVWRLWGMGRTGSQEGWEGASEELQGSSERCVGFSRGVVCACYLQHGAEKPFKIEGMPEVSRSASSWHSLSLAQAGPTYCNTRAAVCPTSVFRGYETYRK